MKTVHRFLATAVLVLWILCIPSVAIAQPRDYGVEAKRILDATGVEGGLVVHIGCGDGKLAAALRVNDRYVVQGLDTDAANVDRARKHADSLGVYGPLSFDAFDGERLPYVGDTVNLVVAEDLGDVSMAEVTRVLCPDGVAYIKRDGK